MNSKLQTSHCLIHLIIHIVWFILYTWIWSWRNKVVLHAWVQQKKLLDGHFSEYRNAYCCMVYFFLWHWVCFSLVYMVVPLSSLFQHTITHRYSTHISVTHRFVILCDVILHWNLGSYRYLGNTNCSFQPCEDTHVGMSIYGNGVTLPATNGIAAGRDGSGDVAGETT